jgi:hypothetical protein
MHGDFAHRDLIVITEDDYNDYRSTRPAIATKVDQLLLEHPVLFVGFSLDDPNVSRILNWVRSTVGTLQLPSVSLVHSPPSRPECELWASRGIRLVHCPASVPLAELLEVLEHERQGRPGDAEPEDDTTKCLVSRLKDTLASTSTDRVAKARDIMLQILSRADSGKRSVIARAIANVQANDWGPILEALSHHELTPERVNEFETA